MVTMRSMKILASSVLSRPLLLAAGLVVLLAGCTFSIGDTPDGVAVELIEGELADQLGITGMVATCHEPPNRDVGTTFSCIAQSDSGEIRWTAKMEEDDIVNVQSNNVLDADDISVLESSAIEALESSVGADLPDGITDCGEPPLVVADDNNVLCALTDPGTGEVYDMTLNITDFDTGAFDLNVADEPR